MRKIVLVLSSVILMSSVPYSAGAIENGSDATGISFVVPITMEMSPGKFGGCSGALIAPQIVITAAHCAVDSTGLVNKKIYVGDPGSRSDSINTSDIVREVKMTSSYQSGTYVTTDDIAFLILNKPKYLDTKVELASEAEILALNIAKAPLKIFGYGATSNSDQASYQSPNSGLGYFSSIGDGIKQPDSAIYKPTKGNSCAGDSGGPVMSITASKVLMIGVITGSNRLASNLCGSTQTVFTLVNRYTNLAFAISISLMESSLAISKAKELELNKVIEDQKIETKKITDTGFSLLASFNSLVDQYDLMLTTNKGLTSKYEETLLTANSKITELNAINVDALAKNKTLTDENASLASEISTNQLQISALKVDIEDLKTQIDQLNAKLPKSITCVKGSSTKKVTAVKPKCPTGYKLKAS
jgi:secreted trypsin-like serine protease